ncbi:CAAX prenyl protease 1-like protein [Hibiscus syriacus]|uniref:CAAX prenyl protease n=1 Tax=Hibiscus syriacus TaxID=106335 RepID=A0A6A3BXJ6_HIBSY|nr:CAAX prenyl protease 1-like protein [Hibiscus syriacus]
MAFPYMEAVVGFMILMYLFETYLDLRQHAALKLPTLPKTLEGVISQEKFEKSRAYSLDKRLGNFVLWHTTLVLEEVRKFLAFSGLNEENEILHTLSFLAGVMIWSQKGGPYLAIYLWGFMFVLSLVMMTIYPILIAPLFNKFTPLPDGELRQKIEKLASSLKFPLKKLFVVDGSTRSSHSNAYMYGFFKNKRIVLYDTLIQQCKNDEEIVAVIAHELGHWKLNHTMYSFIAVQILTFLQFGGYTLVRNSTDLFRSFGFDTQPVLIGLIIFQHTVIPIQHLVSFGLNLVSRSFEFQADAFAKKLDYGSALRAGLVKLQEENLSAMNTDPWYSAYHYSHPPLVERLAALDEADKKEE